MGWAFYLWSAQKQVECTHYHCNIALFNILIKQRKFLDHKPHAKLCSPFHMNTIKKYPKERTSFSVETAVCSVIKALVRISNY